MNIDFVQVLLHILNFVILAGGLTLLLYHPIKKFLEKRKTYYEELETRSAQIQQENAQLKAEFEQKQEEFEKEMLAMRVKAEQEAADVAKSYIDAAKAEAQAIISKAEKEAEKRKEHILDSAQTEIGELVIGAAQKLLEDTATPEKTQALYDAFLKHEEDKPVQKVKRP